MHQISSIRFDALAGYARSPMTRLLFWELDYLETGNGNVIGMVVQDVTDKDFSGLVFAKDQKLRFRCVNVTEICSSRTEARAALEKAMIDAAETDPECHYQGDEDGRPVDFFTPLKSEALLNPSFKQLLDNEGYAAAKAIINPMMRWHEDADGNFVEQFQTAGFDQRIWELYLYAAFTELRYDISKEHNVPDLCCSGLEGELCIEAVTLGKSQEESSDEDVHPLKTDEQQKQFLEEYMPIRFAKALTKKRKKRYWEMPHVTGKPFALAIADFSLPMSMTVTRSALETYLFGYRYVGSKRIDGTLEIAPERINRHRWKKKSAPSGFFRQRESTGVSAVLFNNSGTIAKFNRMGVLADFDGNDVLLIREGTMVNHDSNAATPKYFRVVVNSEGYEESWIEGMNVYHNPNADIPLPVEMIPGAAHHHLQEDGQVVSTTPHFQPLASTTKHFVGVNVGDCLKELGDRTHVVFTARENATDS